MTSLHSINGGMRKCVRHMGRRAWLSLASSAVLLAFQVTASPVQAADLMVAAASSLTNAFSEIGKAYELVRPGTRVLFNFGASGQLL